MEQAQSGYKEKEVHPSSFLNKYSLFAPRTENGLKNDYPELRDNPAFEKCSKAELLFVWYFACEASPFINIQDERTRCKRSLEQAYTKNGVLEMGREAKSRMLNMEFKEYLPGAIKSMGQYRMGPRVKEKKMVDKVLSNYEAIVDMDINGAEFKDEDGDKDFDKIKKYVDSTKSIIGTLPSLNKMAEGSSGLSERKVEDIEGMFGGGDFMDSVMDEEN